MRTTKQKTDLIKRFPRRLPGLLLRLWLAHSGKLIQIFAISVTINEVVVRPVAPSDGTAYDTTRAQTATKSYPDGTVVNLNAKTRVLINFDGARRTLFLAQGEVQVVLQHGRSVPMDVVIDDKILQDIGTVFDARVDGTVVWVSVTDGTIRVLQSRPDGERVNPINLATPDPQRDAAYLAAGDLARLETRDNTLLITQQSHNPEEALNRASWLSGILVAKDEPLQEIISQLNARSPIQVLINDPAIGERAMGGSFKLDNMGAFLRGLRAPPFELQTVPVPDPDHTSPPTVLLRPITHSKHHP